MTAWTFLLYVVQITATDDLAMPEHDILLAFLARSLVMQCEFYLSPISFIADSPLSGIPSPETWFD